LTIDQKGRMAQIWRLFCGYRVIEAKFDFLVVQNPWSLVFEYLAVVLLLLNPL